MALYSAGGVGTAVCSPERETTEADRELQASIDKIPLKVLFFTKDALSTNTALTRRERWDIEKQYKALKRANPKLEDLRLAPNGNGISLMLEVNCVHHQACFAKNNLFLGWKTYQAA